MSDMSEQEVTAREDIEALARTLNPMLGGIIPLDWSVVEGSEFLTELAKMMLASDWLADFAEGVRAAERERLAAEEQAVAQPEPARYPAGHGFTPSTTPFAGPDEGCLVMLARYPCNWSREEHDPELPPVDLDVFGYRRGRFTTPGK